MPEPVISYLRIRVIKRHDAGDAEVTSDLPHLHQTHIDVAAFQPGNPGSSALGSWTCQLHPPGTEKYAAAKAIYDQLDYLQRLEFYISQDGQSLGKLYYAGVITGIRKGYGTNSVFELSGVSDIGLANLSKPFPGELILSGGSNAIRPFLGTNEVGWTDAFNPFTAGNYTSTNLPALTSGTWSGTTDDMLNVVADSTGTGAALISKSGAIAQDFNRQHYVEVAGRLNPSGDAANAGKMGVGVSLSSSDCTTSLLAFVTAKAVGTNYNLDVTLRQYIASTLTDNTVSAALTSVKDADGLIPLTIGLIAWDGTTPAVTVNGKVIIGANVNSPTGITYSPSTGTNFPFLFFGTPATGSATANAAVLTQVVRYAQDLNPNTTTFKATFGAGSTLHGLPSNIDPGPTFLEAWTRQATKQGIYWLYTPQAYATGTRTLGSVTFATDPGTDRGTNQSVVFRRDAGNLVELQLSANADQFVAGTVAAGTPGTDGGGIVPWRDISTLTKYGVLEDQILAVPSVSFGELRRAAINIQSNRLNLSAAGSKTAVVLRDAQTADVWRELDKVMIHDPELGINYLVARVIGYTFDEGQATQTLTLDQFSVDDSTVPIKRLQQGAFVTAAKFNTR